MMVIDNKYEIGQTVYLKTDIDQLPRLVTAIQIHPNNQIIYGLCCGSHESRHYDFEISESENVELKVK